MLLSRCDDATIAFGILSAGASRQLSFKVENHEPLNWE
jgi:hypothetical protein